MKATWDAIRHRCKAWKSGGDPPVVKIKAACFGVCRSGPIVGVFPDGVWYGDCTPAVIDRIFDEHLCEGRVVTEYVIASD